MKSTKYTFISCDVCLRVEEVPVATIKVARRILKDEGWIYSTYKNKRRVYLCPKCQK